MMRTVQLIGGATNIDRPSLADVTLKQIGQQLGNLAAYNGATKRYYSLAEQSVHLAALVGELGGNNQEQRVALVGNVGCILVGPYIPWMVDFDGTRRTIALRAAYDAVVARFGLPSEVSDGVVLSAVDILEAYQVHLLQGGPAPAGDLSVDEDDQPNIQCWTPHTAGQMWVAAARQLGMR